MNRYIKLLFLIFVSTILMAETKVTILSSSEDRLVIQLTCDLETPEDLAPIDLLIGFPNTALPQISTQAEQTSNHFFKGLSYHPDNYDSFEWQGQSKIKNNPKSTKPSISKNCQLDCSKELDQTAKTFIS